MFINDPYATIFLVHQLHKCPCDLALSQRPHATLAFYVSISFKQLIAETDIIACDLIYRYMTEMKRKVKSQFPVTTPAPTKELISSPHQHTYLQVHIMSFCSYASCFQAAAKIPLRLWVGAERAIASFKRLAFTALI